MTGKGKIRVAIAGGTGYTGGELFRILLNHPEVEIVAATTTSSEGTPVASVHRDLIGETDLCFGKERKHHFVICRRTDTAVDELNDEAKQIDVFVFGKITVGEK